MKQSYKLKTAILALGVCSAVSTFADDSFEWHAYMRGSLGMDSGLADITSSEEEMKTLGKYGLEYDDYASSILTKKWSNSKGQWAEYNFGILFYDDDAGYENDVYLSDNYVTLGGLDFLPAGSSIWIGKKKDTSTINLLDYDYRNFYSHGFGYLSDNLDLNFYKKVEEEETGEYADIAAIDAIVRFAAFAAEATVTKATADSTEISDDTVEGDTSMSVSVSFQQDEFFGILPGRTAYMAQYGYGVSADKLNTPAITDPEDNAIKVTLSGTYATNKWTVETTALAESTDDNSENLTYSTTTALVRGTQSITDNLSMIYEGSIASKDNVNLDGTIAEENDGTVYKIAAGPSAQLDSMPWVRPIVRLTTAIIGGDQEATGFDVDSELRLGAQFETWF